MSMFGVGGLDGAIKVLICRGRDAANLLEESRGGEKIDNAVDDTNSPSDQRNCDGAQCAQHPPRNANGSRIAQTTAKHPLYRSASV